MIHHYPKKGDVYMRKSRYTYKFTNDGYDYYLDNETDMMVKFPEDTPRSDKYMMSHAVDAEQDFAVMQYFSD
jgi:hypothetical protein